MISAYSAEASAYLETISECSVATSHGLETISAYSDNAHRTSPKRYQNIPMLLTRGRHVAASCRLSAVTALSVFSYCLLPMRVEMSDPPLWVTPLNDSNLSEK